LQRSTASNPPLSLPVIVPPIPARSAVPEPFAIW
jgi:hypothetical protein